MIVLDASALIAFLDPADALHADAAATMRSLGPQAFGLSPITHAEILVGPTRAGTLEPTRAALAALGVSDIALPVDAAPRLASLRANTRLTLPDCCVCWQRSSRPGRSSHSIGRSPRWRGSSGSRCRSRYDAPPAHRLRAAASQRG